MRLQYQVLRKIGDSSEIFGVPVNSFFGIVVITFLPSAMLAYFDVKLFGISSHIILFFTSFTLLTTLAKILKKKGYPEGFFKDFFQYNDREEEVLGNTAILGKFARVKETLENIIMSDCGLSLVYLFEVENLRSFDESEICDFLNSINTEIKQRIKNDFQIQFIFSKRENTNKEEPSTNEIEILEILQKSEKDLIDNSFKVKNYISFNIKEKNLNLQEIKRIRSDIEKVDFAGIKLERANNSILELFPYKKVEEKRDFKLDDDYAGVLSLSLLPQNLFFGILDEIKETINKVEISLRIDQIDSFKFKARLERKRDIENKLSIKKGQENIESTGRIFEINEALRYLSDGEKYLECELNILVRESSEEELNKSINKIKNILRKFDGNFYLEKFGSLKRFHKVLPLVSFFKDRKVGLFSKESLQLIPIHSSHQKERKILPLANRECEFFYVDPFDKKLPNKNAIIVAGSGSGKSFLAVSLILKILKVEPDARFIIIDIGGSYRKAVKILEGNYIDIDENTSFQIVPQELNRKNINSFLSILSAFASVNNKQDKADIFDALSLFEKEKKKNSLKEFQKFLNAVNTKLARNLSLYVDGGPFGEIFDQKNSLDLKNQISCLDLKNINEFLSSPEEKSLFLMSLLNQIWNEFANFNDLHIPKYLIIDECWNLINSSVGAEFLESAAKTFRKHNASLITITQSIDDFTRNLSSKAILTNSATKIILKQNTMNQIETIKEIFGFSEKEKEMFSTLQMVKGVFSEIFIARSGMKSVRGGFFPDNVNYYIATSDPSDNIKIEQEKNDRGSYLNAIKALALSSLLLFSIPLKADFWGGDIPFLISISSNTMQTLTATQQILTTTKKQLSNAIKTYDEIANTYKLMESYYSAGADGLQLKDIDMVLGRGTAESLKGVFENASHGDGFNRENLVALKKSVQDAEFVNRKLFNTTKNFNDSLVESLAIKKMYGDTDAKGAIELGNIYTKGLLDLNIVQILQRHADMEFKTQSEKRKAQMAVESWVTLKDINKTIDENIKDSGLDYDDPVRF